MILTDPDVLIHFEILSQHFKHSIGINQELAEAQTIYLELQGVRIKLHEVETNFPIPKSA